MLKNIVIIFFFFLSLMVYSQDSAIVGNWKEVSTDEELSYKENHTYQYKRFINNALIYEGGAWGYKTCDCMLDYTKPPKKVKGVVKHYFPHQLPYNEKNVFFGTSIDFMYVEKVTADSLIIYLATTKKKNIKYVFLKSKNEKELAYDDFPYPYDTSEIKQLCFINEKDSIQKEYRSMFYYPYSHINRYNKTDSIYERDMVSFGYTQRGIVTRLQEYAYFSHKQGDSLYFAILLELPLPKDYQVKLPNYWKFVYEVPMQFKKIYLPNYEGLDGGELRMKGTLTKKEEDVYLRYKNSLQLRNIANQ